MVNVAVTKDKFILEMLKKYPKENVIDEGRTVRVEIPSGKMDDREAVAFALSVKFKGKLKPKKTEISFGTYSVVVKPQGKRTAAKATPNGGSVYYGILGKLPLEKMDVSELRDIDFSFVSSKKLPRNLKEVSDIKGISEFNKELENASKSANSANGINLKIGTFTVKNAVGVMAIVGKEPKADYVVVSKDRNRLYPSFYISYKLGTSAKDFQNYSGISEKTSLLIWKHPETKKFFNKLQALYEENAQEEVKQEISDSEIIFHAIYGQDYGKKYGIDNVNILAQGKVRISKSGVVSYDHIIENGTLPGKTDPYHPVFGARTATGRGAKTPYGTTIVGFRIGIFPRAYRTRWMKVG